MHTTWEEKAQAAIIASGIDANPSADQIDHMAVLLQAHAVFRDRDAEYDGLWKDEGSEAMVFQIRSKAQRMLRRLSPATYADSAIDIINYAVFAFLNRRDGR